MAGVKIKFYGENNSMYIFLDGNYKETRCFDNIKYPSFPRQFFAKTACLLVSACADRVSIEDYGGTGFNYMKQKILHFDDDTLMVSLYENKFKQKGFDYKHYINPPEIKNELITLVLKESPDLIIMDIIMPVVDGFTATKILKSDLKTKNIPIFGLSNMGQIEDIQKGMDSGMTDYFITNAFMPDEIVDMLKRYLDNSANYDFQYKKLIEKNRKKLNILSNKNTKVLLIVAHPDDETIFCGGTMFVYPNCQWTVVCMTEGDGNATKEEFNTAMTKFKSLGVNIKSHWLGQKKFDKKMSEAEMNILRLEWDDIIKQHNFNPAIVLTHNEKGEYGNLDHKELHKIVKNLFPNVWEFFYPKHNENKIIYKKREEIKLSYEFLAEKRDIINTIYKSQGKNLEHLSSLHNYVLYGSQEIFIST